jgi:cyclophilin family peptidyl-prolyl cis-trans isomerase
MRLTRQADRTAKRRFVGRRFRAVEALEARRLFAAFLATDIPALTVGAGTTTTDITLSDKVASSTVLGTVVQIQTSLGNVDVELFDRKTAARSATPITAANFLAYANANRYDNTVYHRSVAGFVVQGGGFGISANTSNVVTALPAISTFAQIQNEFNADRSNLRGTIAMAKLGGNPNSATSQYFFNLNNNASNLDNQNGGFTVFARVLDDAAVTTDGMAVVDALAAVPRFNAGGAFSELPLRNYSNSNSITVPNLLVVNDVVVLNNRFTVSSSNTNLVTPTIVTDSAGNATLRLSSSAQLNGRATITLTGVTNTGEAAVSSFEVTVGTPVGDVTAPTSNMNSLPAFTTSENFQIVWGGFDDQGAGGVASYNVFVSEGGGAFTPLLTNTTLTETTFSGINGRTYRFYCTATDVAGNVEQQALSGGTPVVEATTTIDSIAPTVVLPVLPEFTSQTTFTVSWGATDSGSGVASYTVFVADNTRGFFGNLVTNSTATSASFTGDPGKRYTFRVIATDVAGKSSPNEVIGDVSTTIDQTTPTSSLFSLPALTTDETVSLFWTGSDAGGGFEVASYTVFVSENGGAFSPLLADTTLTSTSFDLEDGKSYGFYVVAKDGAGNVEAKQAIAERTIRSDRTAPNSAIEPLPLVSNAEQVQLTWGGSDATSGVSIYDVFVSENGGAPSLFLAGTAATSATFTGEDGKSYSFFTRARDLAGNVELAPAQPDATTTIELDVPLVVGAGAGGSGGGGELVDANLVFSPAALRLPKPINGAIVGGTTLKGTVRVRNAGTALATGQLGVEFYLSDDGTVSSRDVLLGRVDVRRAIKLKANATVNVPFSVVLPSNYTGTAYLLALANRPASGGTLAVAETTTADNVLGVAQFQVAPPVLNLTASTLTVKATKLGKRNTATLLVTNNSNVAFKDTLSVLTSLLGADGNTLSEATLSRRVTVPIGKSVKLTVSYTGPAATGTFSLRSRIDPANVFGQSQVDDTATAALGRIS